MNQELARQLVDETFRSRFEKGKFVKFARNMFRNLDESNAFRLSTDSDGFHHRFAERVSFYERVGSYSDDEGNEIDVLTVELRRGVTLERGRIGLRDFAADYLKKGQGLGRNAILAAYFSESDDTWRFSFVKLDFLGFDKKSNGSLIEIYQESEARRFSFLVGLNEHTHTARRQLLPLLTSDTAPTIADIEKAFSVEKVTKDFFSDYEIIFSKAEDFLKGSIPDERPNDKEAKEKRRLLAQRLFNRLMFVYFLQKKGWLSFNSDNNYLQALLSESKSKEENFFEQRLYWLFFYGMSNAHESLEIHNNEFLIERRGDVPYLNGGLFELEDEWDVKGRIKLPNALFDDIFSFFALYNFTIEESTPLDVQVAVDPEMLGKVFEELVTDRQGTGSYYTPRHIVSFMYRESLKHFLAETGIDKQKIKELIERHKADNITIAEAKTLLQKLELLKIVDPACGSGAYLLGCLQELFAITRELDTKNPTATASDDYHRKLKIIQQNLYGVDIDSFAVQIARLRLWLSLVVDFEGTKPEPLPNLDFKIEQGDSLATKFSIGTQSALWRESIREFAEYKDKYFTAKSDEKPLLKAKIDELERDISGWGNPGGVHTSSTFDWAVKFAEVFFRKPHEIRWDNKFEFMDEIEPMFKEPVHTNDSQGFDIVLANPPYGAETAEATLRENFFGRGTTQSKDTYGLFIARGLEILRPNGTLCFIVSDTWRTIRSHRPLRRRILESTTVRHFIDLPPWVFDQPTVNTGIVTLTKGEPSEGHNVIAGDLHNLPAKEWESLYRNLEAVSENEFDAQTLTYARYKYPQQLMSTDENYSFFVASPSLYRVMSEKAFKKLAEIAEVKQGLITADNSYYLRKREGVRGSYAILEENKLLTSDEIEKLTDDEKHNGIDPALHDGRHFLPFDKGGESDSSGGWLPNYNIPTGYFIDWSEQSVERLRTLTSVRQGGRIAARFQNSSYYFRQGLTFSPTGIYSPTFRLGCNAIFGNKGSTIFPRDDSSLLLLGLLASMAVRYILKSYLSHTVETGEEVLLQTPIPPLSAEAKESIEKLVSAIVEKQSSQLTYPYHLVEQKELDRLVQEAYGLTEVDIREIEIWFCRRYDRLAEAQGIKSRVITEYSDHLLHCETLLSKPSSYWNSHPIMRLIASGEGQTLDFKLYLSVSRSDSGMTSRNDEAARSTLKTVASFLNADGGTVLVGVSDAGEVCGIQPDLDILPSKTQNEFREKIQNLFKNRLSPDTDGLIQISFDSLTEGIVCRIDVSPSIGKPIYFDRKLYVRNGIRGDEKSGHELTMWIQNRTSRNSTDV